MRKFAVYFGLAQVSIVILMLVIYKKISLLPYINTSFMVGGTILFLGLVVAVLSSGLFDLFIVSSRKVFTPKNRMKDVMEMRTPSEIMSFSYGPFLLIGSSILLVMVVCLYVYYR